MATNRSPETFAAIRKACGLASESLGRAAALDLLNYRDKISAELLNVESEIRERCREFSAAQPTQAQRFFAILAFFLSCSLATDVYARDYDKYLIQCSRSAGTTPSYIVRGEFYTNSCRASGMALLSEFDSLAQSSENFRWANCTSESFPVHPSTSLLQVVGATDGVTYSFNCSVIETPITGEDRTIREYTVQEVIVFCAGFLLFGIGWRLAL